MITSKYDMHKISKHKPVLKYLNNEEVSIKGAPVMLTNLFSDPVFVKNRDGYFIGRYVEVYQNSRLINTIWMDLSSTYLCSKNDMWSSIAINDSDNLPNLTICGQIIREDYIDDGEIITDNI